MKWILRALGVVGIVLFGFMLWPILLGFYLMELFGLDENKDLLEYAGVSSIVAVAGISWAVLLGCGLGIVLIG